MRAASLVLVALAPALAWGDAEEATLELAGGPMVVRGEAPRFSEDGATRPGGAAAVRLSYGLSDLLAVDVALGLAAATALEFAGQDGGMELGPGTSHYDLRAVRATAGVTARFGARWIPTGALAVGYQRRALTGGAFIDGERFWIGDLPDRSADDLVAVAAVGLEVRLGRSLLLGISAQLVHAFAIGGPGFDALEIPLHVSWAWYPGWFRARRSERLDDQL